MSEASNEEGTTPAQSTHECDIASSLYGINSKSNKLITYVIAIF